MKYSCATCGEVHEGVPGLSFEAPAYYYAVPPNERAQRCALTSDTCIIDQEHFFVRGCLEIAVDGEPEPFVWGVWVSLSRENFQRFLELYDERERSQRGRYVGWLSVRLPDYPDTLKLKAAVHLRDGETRPLIELEPTDHLLALEQRTGMSRGRLVEILSLAEHRVGQTGSSGEPCTS